MVPVSEKLLVGLKDANVVLVLALVHCGHSLEVSVVVRLIRAISLDKVFFGRMKTL